jgi:hypothetical protein
MREPFACTLARSVLGQFALSGSVPGSGSACTALRHNAGPAVDLVRLKGCVPRRAGRVIGRNTALGPAPYRHLTHFVRWTGRLHGPNRFNRPSRVLHGGLLF